MEVTQMAVLAVCAVAAVCGFAKVVAWLRALDEDDGRFDDADETPEADDARGA